MIIKLKKGKANTPHGDGLPYMLKALDSLAKKLKVTPPSAFEYEDPEFYKEFFGEDLKSLPPKVAQRISTQKDWHDAAVGLRTFKALLEHYRKKGSPAGNAEQEDVIYELEAFKKILEKAVEKKDAFRLVALV